MTNDNFLERCKGKEIHVGFINDKKEFGIIAGKLTAWDKETIEITTETDFDKIPKEFIRKIFIKKNETK